MTLNQTIKQKNPVYTRPSRKCVIQKYRYYTMRLSQYHGCCQHHKFMSILWVFANTMGPCLNHVSMSVPSFWLYTMSPCLYRETFSNPCFHFYTMRNTVFRNTEIQITRIKKYKFQNYRNTYLQKYKLRI